MATVILVDDKLPGGHLILVYEHAEIKELTQENDVIETSEHPVYATYTPSGDHKLTIKLTRKM